MRLLACSLALAVSSSTLARADVVCHSSNTPLMNLNWSTTVSIPRFDPALGTLNFVDVCITGNSQGSYGVETLDPAPNTVLGQVAVQLVLARPNNSFLLNVVPIQDFVDNLSAFDGTIDFGGTSGVLHTGISIFLTTQVILTNASDLILFSGAAGNPGSIGLPVTATGASTASGSGHLITQFSSQASAMVSICYDYTPVAAPFCPGDGSGAACPCGNNSPIGSNAGCLSSIGSGARLRGSGFASLASDSLVLTCTNLPATTTGLFFQGVSLVNGGAGALFGDGLRCAGGTIVRVARKIATSGVVSYPQVGDVSISVRGAVSANSTRYYQVWYRNSASFCTALAFNLSQGVAVHWTP